MTRVDAVDHGEVGRLAMNNGGIGEDWAVLVLAATPIGNPDDASPHLVRLLAEADVIAAEDTRRLRRLAASLSVELIVPVVSYFEGNESARTPALLDDLVAGKQVLLVTDAGMPSVSDPGYRLVEAAIKAGVRVTAVPGPSAVTTALAVSGLPVDRFSFEGFLPKRRSGRSRFLAELAQESRTMVFFESRHRLAAALNDMAQAFGADRRAAVCRELTKTHEEIKRGVLSELVAWAQEKDPRGEITIVVAGFTESGSGAATLADAVAYVRQLEDDGSSRKDAIARAARDLRLVKREVYQAVHATPPD
jgi:16S rRNA (cytidine1402-2'-O)-methyltransferase